MTHDPARRSPPRRAAPLAASVASTALAALAAAPSLGAQDRPLRDSIPLAVGAPVRFRATDDVRDPMASRDRTLRMGTFVGWRGDTLLVREGRRRAPSAIPLAALDRLDEGLGRRRGVSGGVAGAFAGLALGFLAGVALGTQVEEEGGGIPAEAFVGVLGAGAGTVIGAVVGFERGTMRWVRVPLPARR